MTSPEGEIFEYAIRSGFKALNNEAEYEAALAGLSLSIAPGAKKILMTTDSQPVSSQIEGAYEAREPAMQKYLSKLKSMTTGLHSFEVKLVPRTENMAADALSKLASLSVSDKKRNVMVETLGERSIDTPAPVVNTIVQSPEWYDGIVAYKLAGTLPEEKIAAKKLKRDSSWYCIFQGQMYKKGFSLSLLRCVTAYEATKIIEEIHEGVCGNHIGGKVLALKALRASFYWPSMLTEAQAYVKKFDKCQWFAPIINQPANDLHGMDIIGPFTPASGGRKFLIVGIDYFTKWIEAERTAKITANQVKKFIWQNIITKYGIPMGIVMDHGVQFDCGPIRDFLRPYNIKFTYSSVCHPQRNRQAEAANKQILNALKKRLDELKGAWADMVPAVLWSNRTTEKEATGETPFRLAFGAEAVLPVEVGLPNWRILNYDPELNERLHKEELDLLPEVRLAAELKSVAYKDWISKAYNKRVRSRPISKGDFVFRRTTATGKAHEDGKLTAN